METSRQYFERLTDKITLSRMKDFGTLTEMLSDSSVCYGDRTSVTDGSFSLSFSQLEHSVSLFRTVLASNGLKKGSKAGLFVSDSVDFEVAFMAMATSGVLSLIIPEHLDRETIISHCRKYNLEAIVCSPDRIGTLKDFPVRVICTSETTTFKTEPALCMPDDPCTAVFSGGSSGFCRAAVLSHRALLEGTRNGCYGIEDAFDQRYFLVIPLTHVFGLIRNMLFCLYTGSTLYICRERKNMFREIKVFRPTAITLVPQLADMVLSLSRQFGKNMLGDYMKYIICGAAIVPDSIVSSFACYGIKVFPGYGFTESANLVSGNPEPLSHPGSVGRIYPCMDAKIVDGELLLKGSNMASGYLCEKEETDRAFTGGYFKTGDLARIDSDGFLYLLGKKSDIISLPNGEKISLSVLKKYFSDIDGIKDCVVILEKGKLVLLPDVSSEHASCTAFSDGEEELMVRIKKKNSQLPVYEQITLVRFKDKEEVLK